MKKTKIAFCVRDMKIGGVESVMIRTIDALLKNKNLEISVITYAKIREPVYTQWFDAHPYVKVHTLYPLRWLGTDLARFFLFRLIQHVCRDIYRWFKWLVTDKRKFDDIDIFIDYYNFSFNHEFKSFSKPKIVWWHSSIGVFIAGEYVRYMNNYDMLVALTDGFVDEFKQLYPDYANKIARIYNPIDINSMLRQAQSVPVPRGKYFCCVSRLYADKDIPTVLRAFDEFWNKNNRPNVKLFIIGSGSFKERYEQIAAAQSSARHIVFTGALPNPFGYMRGAMASILSSRSEGLPTVLIEAATVDTLNIASDCKNGPCEILSNGAGGMLFTPGNATELARCMSDVFNDRINASEMIKNARDRLKHFAADEISGQIIDLIRRL